MTWIELLLRDSDIAFVGLCLVVFLVMARKRILAEFPLLGALLAVFAIDFTFQTGILFFRHNLGLEIHTAYKIFFYSHWIIFTCETVLQILIIYMVFNLAMAPLKGLQNIGKIIFRWVAAVSIVVSIVIAAGPHLGGGVLDSNRVYAAFIGQIQQGTGILTICLLLFVCFSTKPLGLTYRSRTFGIVLGLGMMATTFLIQTAWTAIAPEHSLYSPIAILGTLGLFASVSVWATYFALPEPERKLILLPTTSPFFFWNRISEALGDAPGHVAIAGFRPDMLASAELQMLSAPAMESSESSSHEHSFPAMPAPLLQAVSR